MSHVDAAASSIRADPKGATREARAAEPATTLNAPIPETDYGVLRI
jgi:hypothetical protein